jgi:diguanylate cyclase (GGDEF)-like protein
MSEAIMIALEPRDGQRFEARPPDGNDNPGSEVPVNGAGRSHAAKESSDAEPQGRLAGPSLGAVGRERYYATRLRQLARLDLEESEAKELWREAARHRRVLERQLGRDVGQRVALLDFIVNVRREAIEPQIIERTALEAIEYRAIADSVTGLYNRHYFETELAREVERGRRYGGFLSLLLLDLDRFKEINDTRGHPVGDRVLQRVGSLIRLHVRAADVPCRIGGDEFGVILPDSPSSDALFVAERIRASIESAFQQEPIGGQQLHITCSGGVATLSPDLAAPHHLFGAADEALYLAKGGGGNRIAEAESRRSPPSADR